ncbi:alpha-tocopherol transfer protein-like [Agrilus planipennis]|uniref:Alpha-tocopherol transfer protein-like n=1 Tax=Agrilus planipennis TaxID=224129 RepID=A0A7F5R5W1_AGRPL|nr:alpha-tocopherol transfer protein-like [Agrilus planipennis]XP_025831224.1 alpha-tocopherol transfer protein-like [Agrilus planipennis]XP_025831225.1 alpha-tocopherol transfer protein-like [Agrilus planipennis]
MALEYGFKASDIVEENRVNWKDINEIKDWVEKQKKTLIPSLTDEQVVSFLLSCNNDLEATKITITAFYNARNDGAVLFNDRNLDRSDIQLQLKTDIFCVLPVRTDDNCAIIFHKLYDTNYSAYLMEPSMKLLFMTIDAAIHDYPPKGLVILFDMKGVGLMHLTRVKLHCIRIFFHYLQEGLPVKLSRVHVLNATIVDKVMTIMRPFIKKEVLELLEFHSSNMDWNDFYNECIPRKCLPSDYGGTLPSVVELHEQNTNKLQSLKGFFETEENQRCNKI